MQPINKFQILPKDIHQSMFPCRANTSPWLLHTAASMHYLPMTFHRANWVRIVWIDGDQVRLHKTNLSISSKSVISQQ